LVNLLLLKASHAIVDIHSGIMSSQLKLLFLKALFQMSQIKVLGKIKAQVKLLLLKALSEMV
jgi:hypothetical protein